MSYSLGLLFAFLHAAIWAVSAIFLRVAATQLDGFLINGLRAAFGMIAYLPMALLAAGAAEYQLLTPYRIFLLIISVLLGPGIGGASSIYAMGRLGIGRSFPFLNLFPFLVMLWSLLFLKGKPRLSIFFGKALTVIGIILVILRCLRSGRLYGAIDLIPIHSENAVLQKDSWLSA